MKSPGKDSPVSREVQQLVHRSFDGPVSADDISTIQQALAASPEAREWYCEIAQIHAELGSRKQTLDLCRQIQIECGDVDSDPRTKSDVENAPNRLIQGMSEAMHRFPFGIAASLLVVGLALGCGVGLFAATLVHVAPRFVALPWNWSVSQDVVAKVTSTHDVRWQPSETPMTLPTQGLRVGQQIRIEEGMIQLGFRDGVSLILSGPAVFEVRSDNGGKLYAGKVSAVSPEDVTGFNIETATGRFQFGPGHYGVEVIDIDAGELGMATQTNVYAFSGIANGVETAQFVSSSGDSTALMDGDAMQFRHGEDPTFVGMATNVDFPQEMPRSRYVRFEGQRIDLANLFDDSKSASLTEAIASDTFQAAGETIDLGVAAVLDGGLDVDVRLAEDGVVFNLANVGGGGPRVRGLPGNDCYRSTHPVAIRTTGEDFGGSGPLQKIEEGIGMCTNELLTFDLDELRKAGELGDREMRFVVDRAGINDRDSEDPNAPYRNIAKVNVVVLVTTEDGVLSAHVNGEHFNVDEHGGVFSVAVDIGSPPRPLRYDGHFASFDVAIPQNARYLTLATTMVGSEDCDHAVFSGARLELIDEDVPSMTLSP